MRRIRIGLAVFGLLVVGFLGLGLFGPGCLCSSPKARVDTARQQISGFSGALAIYVADIRLEVDLNNRQLAALTASGCP